MNTPLDRHLSTKVERGIACLDGAVAGLWIIVCLGSLVAAAGMIATGSASQGGPQLPGIGFLLVATFGLIALTLPIPVVLAIVSWQIWRCHSRGLQNLIRLAWCSSILAIVILVGCAAVWGQAVDQTTQTRALVAMLLAGLPPALFGCLHLFALAPARQSITAVGLIVLAPLISGGIARFPQMESANSGRIKCPRDEFINLKLTDGVIPCSERINRGITGILNHFRLIVIINLRTYHTDAFISFKRPQQVLD